MMEIYGSDVMRTRRKTVMMNAGFAGEMPIGLSGMRKLYYLTVEGHKYLQAKGVSRVSRPFYPSKFKGSLLMHTESVFMVRLVFEQHPGVKDFRPEKVVDYYAEETKDKITAKRFDAEIRFYDEGRDHWAGVEVELDAKSTTAYWNAITKIDAERTDVTHVLWLCKHQAVINRIAGLVSRNQGKLRYPDKHLFAPVDGFLEKRLEQLFYHIDGKAITL